MPYIEPDARDSVEQHGPHSAGELNYLFTQILRGYIKNRGGLSYQVINDIVGALEGSKLEFVRRVVNSYEDKKILENGDVY